MPRGPLRQPRVELASVPEEPLFADPRSRALGAEIARVAPSDANVLVTGETGTGKDGGAPCPPPQREARRPFVAVNCAALPDTLIESELFGHERGAFTGAVGDAAGRCSRRADGGTLFLDEIGELPLDAAGQAAARARRSARSRRVGATRASRVDVRLIAATNLDLDARRRAAVPRGPLLPARGRRAAHPAAARPARATSRCSPQHSCDAPRRAPVALAARRRAALLAPRLAGQRARARERRPVAR